MRMLVVVALCAALGGCAASKQEVVARLGDQYVGKNVDALVLQFGPPTSTFKMSSGDTSYVWQLSAVTDINVSTNKYGNSSGTATTDYCKVNVIASSAGIVTRLTTEDASGTGGLLGLTGVDIYGSICGQRLGMKPQT
jgi:hypothetical protein